MGTDKQGQPQIFFKEIDLLCDSRRRDIKRLCRLVEAAQIRYYNKSFKLQVIHTISFFTRNSRFFVYSFFLNGSCLFTI